MAGIFMTAGRLEIRTFPELSGTAGARAITRMSGLIMGAFGDVQSAVEWLNKNGNCCISNKNWDKP